MKLRLLAAFSLLSLALVAPLARAQSTTPTRIAVIDVQQVLTQSNAGQASYARLKRVQDERIARAKQLDDEANKLEKQAQAATSANARSNLQQQAKEKRIQMQRYAQDADREVSEARDREMQGLEQKIKPVIDAVAAEMQLAAVFNKYESGLIYASDKIDITEEVIRRFNAAK